MKPLLHNIARACMLWNWHTSPTALRTESEHQRHRKAARKVDAWLKKHAVKDIHWHENENTGKRNT
jgi:hypothetical protein